MGLGASRVLVNTRIASSEGARWIGHVPTAPPASAPASQLEALLLPPVRVPGVRRNHGWEDVLTPARMFKCYGCDREEFQGARDTVLVVGHTPSAVPVLPTGLAGSRELPGGITVPECRQGTCRCRARRPRTQISHRQSPVLPRLRPKLHTVPRSLKTLEADSRPRGPHTTSRKDAPSVPWRDTGATVRG